MTKYNNTKIETYEGVFDSQLEWHRWLFLKDQQERGVIRNLERQKPFELIPTQVERTAHYSKTGRELKPVVKVIEQKCSYIADFYYEYVEHTDFGNAFGEALANGRGNTEKVIQVVEDTKSDITKTETYRIKKKLMLYVHHIRIREVKRAAEPI